MARRRQSEDQQQRHHRGSHSIWHADQGTTAGIRRSFHCALIGALAAQRRSRLWEQLSGIRCKGQAMIPD
jgi:hypothetical protein